MLTNFDTVLFLALPTDNMCTSDILVLLAHYVQPGMAEDVIGGQGKKEHGVKVSQHLKGH